MVEAVFESVDSAVRQSVDEGLTAGAVLACGRVGRARHLTCAGHAALVPSPRPLSPETLFDLASLTKVLATTWLVTKWWEEERLDLDAPIGDLLPGRYPADKRSLTVRLLLCHAAGLPSGLRLRQEFPSPPGAPGRREVMERFLSAPLACPPRTRTVYSDIGPILVGDLLEQLSGVSLDRACEAELYAPAGLGDTFYIHRDEPLPKARRSADAFAATEACSWRGRVLAGEVHDENACLLRGVAGHAGLFSSVADLERVARSFLGIEGDARVRPASLAAMATRQDLVPGSSRAVGWDTAGLGGPGGSRLSATAFGHTGFTGTSLWIDPEAGLYVALLANRIHPTRDEDGFLAFRPRLHDLAVEALEGSP